MIERQRREHALEAGRDGRADPRRALQRVGDEIAVRQDRALGDARGAAGVLQQRGSVGLGGRIRQRPARGVRAGVLHHGEAIEPPGRHGVAQVCVGEVERPALEHRHEIAEPHHHDMVDRRLRDDALELVGEILHDHDRGGAAVVELMRELARRIERIDPDHREAGAQRAEERDRIGKHVREHDGDALAGGAPERLAQESREGGAGALPVGIAHHRAEEVEGRAVGVAAAGREQQRVQRRVCVGIDGGGHACRIGREPGCRRHWGLDSLKHGHCRPVRHGEDVRMPSAWPPSRRAPTLGACRRWHRRFAVSHRFPAPFKIVAAIRTNRKRQTLKHE